MAGNRTQKISCSWEECWNHASQKELVLWWWLESNPEGNLLLWEWQETNPKCKLLLCWWRKSNLEGKLLFCEDAGNVPRKVLPLSRMTGIEPGRKAAVPNISSYTLYSSKTLAPTYFNSSTNVLYDASLLPIISASCCCCWCYMMTGCCCSCMRVGQCCGVRTEDYNTSPSIILYHWQRGSYNQSAGAKLCITHPAL